MTVLTVGETMALLDPLEDGQARLGLPLTLRFVVDVAERAKEQGATVVFDPNFRAALPDIPEAAAERQRPVLRHVDWYLCSENEAELLWPREEIPARSMIRIGARGAIVDGVEVPPPRAAAIVDDVGAGDAFAAGFAYGLLEGWEPADCGHAGNVIAARALAGTGDWETLPRLEGVRADLHRGAANRRRRHSSPSAACDAGRPDSRSSPG